jgi:hypothetical protein
VALSDSLTLSFALLNRKTSEGKFAWLATASNHRSDVWRGQCFKFATAGYRQALSVLINVSQNASDGNRASIHQRVIRPPSDWVEFNRVECISTGFHATRNCNSFFPIRSSAVLVVQLLTPPHCAADAGRSALIAQLGIVIGSRLRLTLGAVLSGTPLTAPTSFI